MNTMYFTTLSEYKQLISYWPYQLLAILTVLVPFLS